MVTMVVCNYGFYGFVVVFLSGSIAFLLLLELKKRGDGGAAVTIETLTTSMSALFFPDVL